MPLFLEEHASVRFRVASIVRVVLTLFIIILCAVPWVIAFSAEELLRLVAMGGKHRMSAAAWSCVSIIYDDMTKFASHVSEAYRQMRWRWNDNPAITGDRVVLTFDDAPGDNEQLLEKLLDVLKEFEAHASFFCTTDTIAGMEKLMERLVRDGHEACNHMPEDKSYAWYGEESFAAELRKAEVALEPFNNSGHGKRRQKWFRPPNGAMSSSMSRVLAQKGYEAVLGDVFSNDVFVGGHQRRARSSKGTVAWHAKYCRERTTPGSIVIFHVPRKQDRWSAVDITRAFLRDCKERGLSCVSLSEMAELHSHGKSREVTLASGSAL